MPERDASDPDATLHDLPAAVEAYDRAAEVRSWQGPRGCVTFRLLGRGRPLILVPGISTSYRSYALVLNRLARRGLTVTYDYPGENADDGADLGRIDHAALVDDLIGLARHLGAGPVHLLGLSFGTTVTLAALATAPTAFERVVVQGAFARRHLGRAERWALAVGRRIPGRTAALPFRGPALLWSNGGAFPGPLRARWPFYVAENGRTSIAGLAHRLDLLADLDLRPRLPSIPHEVLVYRGQADRIIPLAAHEEVVAGLVRGRPLVVPGVGHIPHYTDDAAFSRAVGEFLFGPGV